MNLLDVSIINLLVVDNISLPLMPLILNDEFNACVTRGSKISQMLHQLSVKKHCAVLLVSNLRGVTGEDTRMVPALGMVWNSVANVRILLARESDSIRTARKSRMQNYFHQINCVLICMSLTFLTLIPYLNPNPAFSHCVYVCGRSDLQGMQAFLVNESKYIGSNSIKVLC